MPTGFKVDTKDLDDVFDPYVTGTKPALTTYKAGTQDLRDRYAPIVYGTAAPVTNFAINGGADLNTLFAAKGTAAYTLPIDGQRFTAGGVAATGQAAHAYARFNIAASGWTVTTSGTNNPTVTKASGDVPVSAKFIQITATWENAPGDTNAGLVSNECQVDTAIPAVAAIGCTVKETASDTTAQTSYELHITMKDAFGTVISSTTCYFSCITSTG